MQNFNWQLDNFALGMHTEPAKTQGGERYAAEIQNLRVDSDGWLRERSAVEALGPNGVNITGVAATPKHIFVLRADGKLYIRDRDDLDTETEITGASDLEGRISVVDFNTYVILTSEGGDQGYWVNLQDTDNIVAYSLGIEPPGEGTLTATADVHGQVSDEERAFGHAEETDENDQRHYNFLYRMTYVRRHGKGLNIPEDAPPFLGMESNGGPNISVLLSRDQNSVFLQITHSDDPQVTGVNIYRNDVHPTSEFRQIQDVEGGFAEPWYIPKGTASVRDLTLIDQWAEGAQIEVNNERLPAEVKSLHKYNDIVFAPAGDRLIYSDVRLGTLIPWAYPAVNEIRTGEQVTFCAELREVLLFGGRGRLSRLSGTDEYNFNIDTLSHRGPVDGYSWNRLTDVLAYIGEGAFFITNASDVQAVSEPILNKVFKDKKLLTGSVVFLQDGDILYDFKTSDKRYQYKLEDGAWARWADIDIVQAATIIERVDDQDCATVVLIADGTGVLKELNWNSTEGADDADWRWESNIISGLSQGVANKFKRFRELEWTGQADGDVTLEVFNADDPAGVSLSTKVFNARESLRPVRVPINRKMRRMVFRVSGTGIVKLQGLRLEMQV